MKKSTGLLIIGVVIAFAISLSVPFWYPEWAHNRLPESVSVPNDQNGFRIAELGQFGDSFGMLTSIASFFTLLLVLYSVFYQKYKDDEQRQTDIKRETAQKLKDTEREDAQKLKDEAQRKLENQRDFENNFFRMIEVFDRLRDGINEHWLHKGGYHNKGREIFGNISTHMVNVVEKNYAISSLIGANILEVRNLEDKLKSMRSTNIDTKKEKIITGYLIFYTLHKNALAHYFATLYNIISVIDSGKGIEDIQKKKYVKILRATLSTYELNVLYYNSISPMGYKFEEYINRYDLLDNLDFYSAIPYKDVIPTIYKELQESYNEYKRTMGL